MARARTIVKRVSRLSDDEYQILLKMNMGHSGEMRGALIDSYLSGTGYVSVHYDRTWKIDGWALINQYKEVQVFVPEKSRRQGIGTKVLIRAAKIAPSPIVYPWDDRSNKFFEKVSKVVSLDR